NPTGSYDKPWTGAGTDPRMPSSPYLSSTLPTIPSTTATFGRFDQITDIAPDGKFVNLWNLAPKYNGARVSGWNARSGSAIPAAPAVGLDGQIVTDLNYRLTLLDASGSPGLFHGQTLPVGTGLVDANIPAHWSMLQNICRPAKGPMFYAGPANAAY